MHAIGAICNLPSGSADPEDHRSKQSAGVDILDATVTGHNGSVSHQTTPCIMAMCAQRHVHVGVEEKDVEVAKDILDAIMSGHVEGMPGEDAEAAAEEEAQDEAPRGARRCSAHASQLHTRLFAKPESL